MTRVAYVIISECCFRCRMIEIESERENKKYCDEMIVVVIILLTVYFQSYFKWWINTFNSFTQCHPRLRFSNCCLMLLNSKSANAHHVYEANEIFFWYERRIQFVRLVFFSLSLSRLPMISFSDIICLTISHIIRRLPFFSRLFLLFSIVIVFTREMNIKRKVRFNMWRKEENGNQFDINMHSTL